MRSTLHASTSLYCLVCYSDFAFIRVSFVLTSLSISAKAQSENDVSFHEYFSHSISLNIDATNDHCVEDVNCLSLCLRCCLYSRCLLLLSSGCIMSCAAPPHCHPELSSLTRSLCLWHHHTWAAGSTQTHDAPAAQYDHAQHPTSSQS